MFVNILLQEGSFFHTLVTFRMYDIFNDLHSNSRSRKYIFSSRYTLLLIRYDNTTNYTSLGEIRNQGDLYVMISRHKSLF